MVENDKDPYDSEVQAARNILSHKIYIRFEEGRLDEKFRTIAGA